MREESLEKKKLKKGGYLILRMCGKEFSKRVRKGKECLFGLYQDNLVCIFKKG